MNPQTTTSHSPAQVVMNSTVAGVRRLDDVAWRTFFAGSHRSCQASEAPEAQPLIADDSTVAKDTIDWLRGALDDLQDLRRLAYNWDGLGSPPPLDSIVCSAESVLSRLTDVVPSNLPSTFVCPVSGGGLGLEWRSQAKHLEIEFVSETEVVWLTEDLSRLGACDAMDAGEADLSKGVSLLRDKLLWFAS